MRIGIVGGVERSETAYREIAEESGHELVFHSGYVGGRGSSLLSELVARVDLLVVLTDVNSHGAVSLARRAARKHGTRLALRRRCNPAGLAALVARVAAAAGTP